MLKATPELWTLWLPHRTQILYFADISYVVASLELSPGCLVIEAGTGSGSMTHSIARTVAPNGKVYTFDFHEKRSEEARIEFESHGLGDVVVAQHRDVCSNGFPEDFKDSIDAVFLDLPRPWDVVISSKQSLKSGGRICCFSPCIEQVQKTAGSLRENLFIEMSTIEVLIQPIDTAKTVSLRKIKFDDEQGTVINGSTGSSSEHCVDYTICFPTATQAGHTGYLTFATKI
jgi:tRNA (adenine57-N1/adenine58-N1)-methyltransferase